MFFGKRIFTAIWFIASVAGSTCAIAQSPPNAVLIMDESDPGSPFSRQFRDQVYSALAAEVSNHYAIYSEYMDLGHFNQDEYDAILHEHIDNKYRNKPISVVIAFGTGALKFLSHMRRDIWRSVPIVFVTFDDGLTGHPDFPSNATGIVVTRRFEDLVKSAVNDTLHVLKPQAAEQGVTLEVEHLPANLWVRADSTHIQQVLLNLAMNGIDAMQNVSAEGRKLILAVQRGTTAAMVAVKDTGPGIPKEKLAAIFEPFVTTKLQGTGLGLSISLTIISAYGGNVWAENRPEGGAIFRFTLD